MTASVLLNVISIRSAVARILPKRPLLIFTYLLAGSILAFIGHFLFASSAPLLGLFLALMSGAGCGWNWLLARALFRPNEQTVGWPIKLVILMFTVAASLVLIRHFGVATDTGAIGLMQNMLMFVSSTVLLMPLAEAGRGLKTQGDNQERRFRYLFLGAYSSLILIYLAVDLPEWSAWQQELKVALALSWLIGMYFSVRFRLARPLENPIEKRVRTKASAVEVSVELVDQIKHLLAEQKLYLDHELKVAGLAEKLAEQEYKVTQAITTGLGFRNFNHLINSYRIEHAKELLHSAENQTLPILSIALESGFGSVGPFNRAFKALVGVTPGEFRRGGG